MVEIIHFLGEGVPIWRGEPPGRTSYRKIPCEVTFTACASKIDRWPRNILLSKNPQFLPNIFETWSKLPTNEMVILTKSQKSRIKIADFLIKAYFWAMCQFWVHMLY